ncbi:MAG: SDR family NAD(P)-dependent oxidoreductase, partial [Balneolaceae bacterium]|nr:SDR family NAD(P)-dependent oxidoreductase [Balneolaceae bacterium]
MNDEMSGKVAIVTGAATGIGRATAIAYARLGVKVTVADVNTEELEHTHTLVEDEGGEALSLATDISKPDEVRNMVEKTVEKFGRLDYACNNAG